MITYRLELRGLRFKLLNARRPVLCKYVCGIGGIFRPKANQNRILKTKSKHWAPAGIERPPGSIQRRGIHYMRDMLKSREYCKCILFGVCALELTHVGSQLLHLKVIAEPI